MTAARSHEARGHAPVALRAEEHFVALRGPVWARLRGRSRRFTRDSFDDAYQEWWTRELERAAGGRRSEALAPVAFVTDAVQRVVIDEARARARGLSRAEKHTLELEPLDEHLDLAVRDDTPARAHFEALAHRVVATVRGLLTERDLRVFVWGFIYRRSADSTAEGLGMSAGQVRKARARIAERCGAAVWPLLIAELPSDAAPGSRADVAMAFEVLAEHVEDCAGCRDLAVSVHRHGEFPASRA